jgi:hypothetical protein
MAWPELISHMHEAKVERTPEEAKERHRLKRERQTDECGRTKKKQQTKRRNEKKKVAKGSQ